MFAVNNLSPVNDDFVLNTWGSLLSPINEDPIFSDQHTTFFSTQTTNQNHFLEHIKPTSISPLTTGNWTVRNIAQEVQVTEKLFTCVINSRDEVAEANVIPPEQYSSIKYGLRVLVDEQSIGFKPSSFVLSKLRVVYADTEEEVQKNGNPIIGTSNNLVLEAVPDHQRSATYKYTWLSVSYHHRRQDFRLVLEFYKIENGNELLLFDALSDPFSVKARRPNVSLRKHLEEKIKKTEKRKSQQIVSQPKKKAKTSSAAETVGHVNLDTLPSPGVDTTTVSDVTFDPFSVMAEHYSFESIKSPVPLQKFLNLIDLVGDKLSEQDREIIKAKL
jgi:hypothetical protein